MMEKDWIPWRAGLQKIILCPIKNGTLNIFSRALNLQMAA